MAGNQRRNEESKNVETEGRSAGDDMFTLGDIPGGPSCENLLALFGNGTENKTFFDSGWLTRKGFTDNTVKGHKCSICSEVVKEKEVVYNIKCGDSIKHPLHIACA